MKVPSNGLRVMAIVLLCAWLSATTMLVPWPPVLIDIFASKGVTIPSGAIWIRWIAKLVLIVGGSSAAFLWLRGSRRAARLLILFSVVYLVYWISEYLSSPGQILEAVSVVARQIDNAEGLRRLTILQHQIVLPTIHLAFLILSAARRWSAHAEKATLSDPAN